jgi:Cdc6-like AAA superfamily ATPase
MYCPGMPGAGKTLLTAVVVEELNSRFQDDESIGVAYLYCNFRRQHEQRADNLLSSLLKQLIQPLPSAPDCVQSLYKRHKSFGTYMTFDELLTCLKSVIINTYSRVFFIVDALDECQVSGNGRTKFQPSRSFRSSAKLE